MCCGEGIGKLRPPRTHACTAAVARLASAMVQPARNGGEGQSFLHLPRDRLLDRRARWPLGLVRARVLQHLGRPQLRCPEDLPLGGQREQPTARLRRGCVVIRPAGRCGLRLKRLGALLVVVLLELLAHLRAHLTRRGPLPCERSPRGLIVLRRRLVEVLRRKLRVGLHASGRPHAHRRAGEVRLHLRPFHVHVHRHRA